MKIITPKNILLSLIVAEAALIIVLNLEYNWLFYPVLILGVTLVLYAFSIKCGHCEKRQVFRGFSIFDLRFPKDNCYYCGSVMKERVKDNNMG